MSDRRLQDLVTLFDYDITFSARGGDCYKRRRKTDRYGDFRMLPDETEDEILFFGGKDYVALFCELIKVVKSRRTVFYSSAEPPAPPRLHALAKFDTTTRKNGHYEGANTFLQRTV